MNRKNAIKRCLAAAIAVVCVSLSAGTSYGVELFGIQRGTGQIVRVNPNTGLLQGGFAAPDNLNATHTALGLSGAEGGNVLLYRNDNGISPTSLFRLNPITGAVLSVAGTEGWLTDGLSYQNNGGHLIFSSHTPSDVHRQAGYGGAETYFWEGGLVPSGGLGGDGFGREFGFYTDNLIHEYNPFVSDGVVTSSLAAPALDIQGMAFDGTSLFVSTASGSLYTLNPNTGAVLNNVVVQNGALWGLGVAVPEPSTLIQMLLASGFGISGLLFRRWRK